MVDEVGMRFTGYDGGFIAPSTFTMATVMAAGAGYAGVAQVDWCASKVYQRKRARTEKRARKLLDEYLTVEQQKTYAFNGSIIVTGNKTGKKYEVHHPSVYELDDNNERGDYFCFYPTGGLCSHDIVLAKKIALETNEEETLKIANRIPIQRRAVSGLENPVFEQREVLASIWYRLRQQMLRSS